MLPWNYATHSNHSYNTSKRNNNRNNVQNKQNSRPMRQRMMRNNPTTRPTRPTRAQYNKYPNNRQQGHTPLNSPPQDNFESSELERIKRAIKENRIEFVDGGARIIDETHKDTNSINPSLNNKDDILEENVEGKVTEEKGIEETNKTDKTDKTPIVNNNYFEKLTEFIQNERNASIFYKYLASTANKDENAEILDTLSQESLNRYNSLNNIYEDNFGEKFQVKKSKINNTIKFKDGIVWAIEVENRGLIDMVDFYENLDAEKYSKKINSIMYRKTCDISFLHLILSTTKGIFS